MSSINPDSASAQSSESTPKVKVLIVEDTIEIRQSLAMYLRRVGFDVQEAADGREGLASVQTFVPTLIISDINMPNMDGLQMGRTLRESNNPTPILYMSTMVSASSTARAVAEITKFTLPKPALPSAIKAKIDEILGKAA